MYDIQKLTNFQNVTNCKNLFKKPKVLEKIADNIITKNKGKGYGRNI